MTPSRRAVFNASDVLGLFSRYRGMMILGSLLSLALFLAAAEVIPKKFKSSFALTIYGKYFQIPLVRDILPEMNDPGEMKSQREALIRRALSPEFLDSLDRKYDLYQPSTAPSKWPPVVLENLARLKAFGEKWGLSQPPRPDAGNAVARQELLSRIEVISLGNTTFQVSFINADPDVTIQATRDIHAEVVRSLLESRTRNLVTLRNAIRKRLETVAFNMASAPDSRATLRPQLLKEELADIRNQARALGAQYTDEHPLLTELRERERVLIRWIESAPPAASGPSWEQQGNNFAEDKSGASVHEMFNDLTRKLDYLNIALESDKAQQDDYFSTPVSPLYPKAPLWPKKGLFALWGLAGGLFASLFLAAMRNYFDRSALHAEDLAERLGIPFLGGLPAFPRRRLLR